MYYTVKRTYTAEITETWVISAPRDATNETIRAFARKYIDGQMDPDDQEIKKVGSDNLIVDPH